ncbi:hypothetical protein BDA96_08G013700 [Sorghum bicolor]|uniref:Uncharacterized protein n=2 Tax=Sorghum bicolor TaxID=4558 RepID=A0A1B6PB08_SORBI|nr:hypothetical protein BDA96_08G013700 [Sorghum bicolor]KXG22821.1 hypothetical protein SORBI_3008G012500 [Sorghum bicolor]
MTSKRIRLGPSSLWICLSHRSFLAPPRHGSSCCASSWSIGGQCGQAPTRGQWWQQVKGWPQVRCEMRRQCSRRRTWGHERKRMCHGGG